MTENIEDTSWLENIPIEYPTEMPLDKLQKQVLKQLKDQLEVIKEGRICSKEAIKISLEWGINKPTLQKVFDHLKDKIEQYEINFTETDRYDYVFGLSLVNRFETKVLNTTEYKERKNAILNGMKKCDSFDMNNLEHDIKLREDVLHHNKLCRCFRFKN